MSSRLRKLAYGGRLRWRERFGDLREAAPSGPPEPVRIDPSQTVAELWRARIAQHTSDSYVGVPIAKLPEDLRAYQHALWEAAPEVVVEVGVKFGGSALWFRDQLRMLATYGRIDNEPLVIGVDLETVAAERLLERADPAWDDEIRLIGGDIREPAVTAAVREAVPDGTRCMVVEDAAHTAEVTTAALRGLSSLVPPGGFFVVEDAHVDDPELHPEGPTYIRQLGVHAGGVAEAIEAFLGSEAGAEFEVRREFEPYGITSHPGGFLRRRSGDG